MSEGMIKVGMADVNVCHAPGAITTLGLGSCVRVSVLYDRTTRTAGLAHVCFRTAQGSSESEQSKICRYRNRSSDRNASERRCKLFNAHGKDCPGDAQMFAFSTNNDMLRVGERNVEAVKAKLKELGIRILAEDTGANYGEPLNLSGNRGIF